MSKENFEMKKHLNLVMPQWQGGGQDLSTYYGAFALAENYLSDGSYREIFITRDDISPVSHGILGYREILMQLRKAAKVLEEERPSSVIAIGGGCDADIPCIAYLSRVYGEDMTVVYMDAHGDLNTPQLSESNLFYGMSLRALTGESDPAILDALGAKINTENLILCGNRNLDPEELRFIESNHIPSFSVLKLEESPSGLTDFLASRNAKKLYIHIDLDVLDPTEFSLTPLHEPNGLRQQTLLWLVDDLRRNFDVVGLGILEYSGSKKDQGDPVSERLVEIGLGL